MKQQRTEITSLNPEELTVLFEKVLDSKFTQAFKNLKQPDDERYLSRQEVAKLLDVDLTTIWRYCNSEKLTAYSIKGTKRVYFKKSEVIASLVKVNEGDNDK